MATDRITVTMSDALLAALDRQAEVDSPGAPNRSATAVRLIARALSPRPGRRSWHLVFVRPWADDLLARRPEWRPVIESARSLGEGTMGEILARAGIDDTPAARRDAGVALRSIGWHPRAAF